MSIFFQKDDYVGVSVPAPSGYVFGYEPLASYDRVHHYMLYGCEKPYDESGLWKGQEKCGEGKAYILYVWARNAPDYELPEGVRMSIGNKGDDIKYLVLSIHYGMPLAGNTKDYTGVKIYMTTHPPPMLAAVYALASSDDLPPKLDRYYVSS
ncbi:hypothetical protein WR25_13640 [Diploscapter pachys]|uniref:peptidylglycine monooxygenase n=1 Tax=Diploscapter pachys TaxID=2018661 RepID=A0A2A2KPD1_9BILA|nr:hypothetical protein WR25_13640 [Diploscapter pachys]